MRQLTKDKGYVKGAPSMFNVCPNCGEYSEEKTIDPTGPYAICPTCGHAHKFVRHPLYSLTGASGTGKSTVGVALASQQTGIVCIEADIFWRSEYNTPKDDYLGFRNMCLRAAKNINQSGRPTLLCGSATPGQYEACPEFRYFDGAHYLALMCVDDVLTERLKQRPVWRKSASREFIEAMLNYNRWFKENVGRTAFPMTLLDTTHLTVEESVEAVKQWLKVCHKPIKTK
jgi:ribosomal protein L32